MLLPFCSKPRAHASKLRGFRSTLDSDSRKHDHRHYTYGIRAELDDVLVVLCGHLADMSKALYKALKSYNRYERITRSTERSVQLQKAIGEVSVEMERLREEAGGLIYLIEHDASSDEGSPPQFDEDSPDLDEDDEPTGDGGSSERSNGRRAEPLSDLEI